MTTQEFFNRYQYNFTANQVGSIMTDQQWRIVKATGAADAIKELAAEIATTLRCKSEMEVRNIVDNILASR